MAEGKADTEGLVEGGASARWVELNLFFQGRKFEKNCALAPRTAAAIEALPGGAATSQVVGAAKFSVIEPGTHIRAHGGGNNARLRVHLPLLVPAPPAAHAASWGRPRAGHPRTGMPCLGFRVGGVVKT